MKNKKVNLLSVIVPAYKQAKTIQKDLEQIADVLENSRFKYEIICVIDGYVDKTFQKAKRVEGKKIRIISYGENKGKGYAVRYGMAKANGDFIAFIDAGMDINPKGIPLLLEHMIWYNSDVIVGSIRHSASRVLGYPIKRKIYSIGYHFLIKMFFGLKVTDSQRGLKIFKREVLEKVLPRLMVKKFAFDIEILSVARRLGFTRIHDGPVEMDARKMRYSSIKYKTILQMLIDTLAVFYRLHFLRYYDHHNRRKWSTDPELKFA